MNKMWKTARLSIALVIIFALVGCGASASELTDDSETSQTANNEGAIESRDDADTETESTTGQESTDAGNNKGNDTLVVYFSRTGEQYKVGVIDKGNTAIVAEMISEQIGADLWEVIPVEDIYPTDSYNNLIDVAKKEQNDNTRPAYEGEVPDLSQYSTIFIGAPVWWGDWPMIMYTFFENNREGLAGKTLIPFSTHEGSGLSGFDKKLSSACPNSMVGQGLAIRGNDCQNDQDSVRSSVKEWLVGLGY
ncbi:flavodoxin [Butyrivibrio sp. M55]|uniref:flavodoxin n=1 Tax=Butyrivibrio sp. M55 TaxID=1855323 RepID=UPI0008EC4476|nr:flavodoxin [Butyrivibrio sp. M55]SFU43803.1 Flavodoxin [Butyrivibrio sp. M55]